MININSRSSTPIYQQIVEGIKEDILKGILQPSDKLPSVREMSSLIMANPNTISRAYKELERQSVIETVVGKGTFVSSNYKPIMEEKRMKSLEENIKKIIIEAKYMGISKDEIIKIMENFYKETDNLTFKK